MMTLTIEIPALDRLCAILEQRDRGNILEELKDEITRQLAEAARDGSLEKAAEAETETETSSVTADAVPPSPTGEGKGTAKATETAKATGEGKGITLTGIQKAAAQMRDEGKLQSVKDLFPAFGIRKLSDLKDDQLAAFAGKLREMGAKI